MLLKILKFSPIVACCFATLSTLYALAVFKLPLENSLLLISFFGTLLSYNTIDYFSIKHKKKLSDKQLWVLKNSKLSIITSLTSIIILTQLASTLNTAQLINYFVLIILVFLYEKSFFKFHLRKILFFKPIIISLCWTMATIGTVYFSHPSYGDLNIFILIENFLSIIPLCLYFDIRDYRTDIEDEFKTLVHSFGVERIKSFSIRLYIFSLLLRMTFIPFREFWWLYTLEVILFLGVTKRVKAQKSYLKYIILVDSLMIVKLLYVLEHL